MAPRRFLDGVTNVSKGQALGNLPYLDPTKYSIWYEDFFTPSHGAAITNATATYDGIKYTADTSTVIDHLPFADANGVLSMVITSTDNALGYAATVAPSMRLRSGKRFFLDCKFYIDTEGTIGQSEMFVGLADESLAASKTAFMNTAGTALNCDDAFGFVAYDGSAEVRAVVREADVGDEVPMGTAMVDATWYQASMYFDGTDIYYFVNGVAAGAFTPTAIPVSAIGPCYWFKAGETQVQTLLVDYMFVAAER